MTDSIKKAELMAELEESKSLLASYDLECGPQDRTPSEQEEYRFHWERINEIEQELILLEKGNNIPNCTLWEAVTKTGGLLQVLVPFGEDEAPYLASATDDLDVIEGEWANKGDIYSLTIRELLARL